LICGVLIFLISILVIKSNKKLITNA
jgi:hypothetical protein